MEVGGGHETTMLPLKLLIYRASFLYASTLAPVTPRRPLDVAFSLQMCDRRRYVEGLRHEFDENRRRPPLRPNEPPFSGSAMWAHSLARAVEEAWFHLKNCKRMAKAMASDEAEAALSMSACREAQAAYTVFVSVIGDFKANRSVTMNVFGITVV